MIQLNKWIKPIRAMLGQEVATASPEAKPRSVPRGAEMVADFPIGFHVYGFGEGPVGGGKVLVGAGNPESAAGAVFIEGEHGDWSQVDLPDETALLAHFLRLSDRSYVAAGMSAIGRGALLVGDSSAKRWECVPIDLHPYCAFAALLKASDGSIIASTGQMITQGKTKPVLFRSMDDGKTWHKDEQNLPISMFLSFVHGPDGKLYAGTAGDHDPLMYRSSDCGRTWEPLDPFPAYKTFKMHHVEWIEVNGVPRLFVVMWGYKTEIADRIVRIYMSGPNLKGWEELPPVDDSHFLFSFYTTRDRKIYVGSEKGRVYRSTDLGMSWKKVVQFPTNIGAYSIFEDEGGRVWIGKDFVPPSDYSLWRIQK